MNCKEFQKTIDLEFRHGVFEMPSELRQHIQSCDSCNAYYGELSRLKESLDEQKFEILPDELDDINFEKIAQSGQSESKKRGVFEAVFTGFRRWAWVPAIAAAVIIILAIIPQFIENTSSIYQLEESSGVAEVVDEYSQIESYDDLALVVVSLLEDDTDFEWAAGELMIDMDYDDMIDDLTDDELKALYDRIEMINGSAG